MTHRFITITGLAIALIGAGFYFGPSTPEASAVGTDFVLTWSSSSYVPLSYEGKALPARGSQIKVFALPVKKLSPNPDYLYYRWLLDDNVVGWANGIGQNVFSFSADKWPGNYHKVESQILDSRQQTILFQGYVYIKIVSPEILASDSNSNYYSAVEKISTETNKKIKLTARPFFFNIKKIADLTFNWQLDGQEISGQEGTEQNLFTLTIPAGTLSETLYKNLLLNAASKTNEREQDSLNLSIEIK